MCPARLAAEKIIFGPGSFTYIITTFGSPSLALKI